MTARISDPLSHKPIKGRQDGPEYAGELANLDENIGRPLDALDETALADNTVVVAGGRARAAPCRAH